MLGGWGRGFGKSKKNKGKIRDSCVFVIQGGGQNECMADVLGPGEGQNGAVCENGDASTIDGSRLRVCGDTGGERGAERRKIDGFSRKEGVREDARRHGD